MLAYLNLPTSSRLRMSRSNSGDHSEERNDSAIAGTRMSIVNSSRQTPACIPVWSWFYFPSSSSGSIHPAIRASLINSCRSARLRVLESAPVHLRGPFQTGRFDEFSGSFRASTLCLIRDQTVLASPRVNSRLPGGTEHQDISAPHWYRGRALRRTLGRSIAAPIAASCP